MKLQDFTKRLSKFRITQKKILGIEFLDQSLEDKNSSYDNWSASRITELLIEDLQRAQLIRVLRETLEESNGSLSTNWENDRNNSNSVDYWKRFFDRGLAQV